MFSAQHIQQHWHPKPKKNKLHRNKSDDSSDYSILSFYYNTAAFCDVQFTKILNSKQLKCCTKSLKPHYKCPLFIFLHTFANILRLLYERRMKFILWMTFVTCGSLLLPFSCMFVRIIPVKTNNNMAKCQVFGLLTISEFK